MSKLIVTEIASGNLVLEYSIQQSHISIGRLEDNDICIDSSAISAHHAKIITEQNDSFIQDLGSTNGTYANGSKVRSHALEYNDIITLGTHNLTFVEETKSSSTENDSPSAVLEIKNGPRAGDNIILQKTMTTLGVPGVQVAAITHRNNEYYFAHIDGGEEQNICMLNGEPTPSTPSSLKDGDIIEVADATMEFHLS